MSGDTTSGWQARTDDWGVRPGAAKDQTYIRAMWERYFGPFDGMPEIVVKGTDSDEPYTYCVVAVAGGERIGAGIATLSSAEYLADVTRLDRDEYHPVSNGYLHFGGVDPDWRNQGVGTALMRARLKWIGQRSSGKVFGLSWVRDGHPDSRALFENFGFEQVSYEHSYYAQTDRRCPDCDGGCDCDAVLYGRNL